MKIVKEYLYEKFIEQSDPIKDMGIGGLEHIKEWFELHCRGIPKYALQGFSLENGEVNINHGIYLPNIDNFPEYIQLGTIIGRFVICDSPNFTSLQGFPRVVKGNVEFRDNGIKPTEEDIKKICDVSGDIILIQPYKFIKMKSQKKYKKLGPISQRPSPKIDYQDKGRSQKYSRGYLLWKTLEFIQAKQPTGGARYKEIVQFKDNFKGITIPRRTISLGEFNSLQRYTITVDHRYFLNAQGREFLRKYKDAFDKGEEI